MQPLEKTKAVGSALACVALVLLAFALSGCEGCSCKRANEKMHDGSLRLYYWDRLSCKRGDDCAAQKCPSEKVPWCTVNYLSDVPTEYPFCACVKMRWVNLDAGQPVLIKCERNRDGGTPICGVFDDSKQAIVDADGGILVHSNRGEL